MIAVVADLGLSVDVQHIQSLYEVADHGVLPTPVLTIGGKIKTKGRLLQKSEIKHLLAEATRNHT